MFPGVADKGSCGELRRLTVTNPFANRRIHSERVDRASANSEDRTSKYHEWFVPSQCCDGTTDYDRGNDDRAEIWDCAYSRLFGCCTFDCLEVERQVVNMSLPIKHLVSESCM